MVTEIGTCQNIATDIKMKKIKKQSFRVSHGTYPFDVMFCVGLNDEEVIKLIGKYVDLTDEDKELLHCSDNGGRTVMLSGNQTVLRVSVNEHFHSHVAHEIFHAVEFLFRKIGIILNDGSDEAFAYQIGYLTKEFYNRLK